MGSKPVGGIFSVGLENAYRWKDSVQEATGTTRVRGRRHRKRNSALVCQIQCEGDR